MPVSYDLIGYGSTSADPFTTARFYNVYLLGILPRVMPNWPDINGRVDFNDGTNRFSIDLEASVERTLSISLTGSMNTNFQISTGFLLEFSIQASVSDISQFVAVYLGTTSNNGANILSQLVAGSWVHITPQAAGIFGTGGNMYGTVARIMDKQVKLLVQTTGDPGGSLNLRYRVAPYDDTPLSG